MLIGITKETLLKYFFQIKETKFIKILKNMKIIFQYIETFLFAMKKEKFLEVIQTKLLKKYYKSKLSKIKYFHLKYKNLNKTNRQKINKHLNELQANNHNFVFCEFFYQKIITLKTSQLSKKNLKYQSTQKYFYHLK